MSEKVVVQVPATSANLGPGFDCLGIALDIHLKVAFSSAESSEIIGAGRRKSLKDSYIHRAFSRSYQYAGKQVPPVTIEIIEEYPSARGLGASAAAIVAGLVGASELGGLELTDEDLGELAIDIEGHADNVLPALLGGLVLKIDKSWVRFVPDTKICPVVLVAKDSFRTKAARKALPETVPIADAVANAAATSTLVAILSGGSDPSRLLAATEDRLHQPYRLPLMEESNDLYRKLRLEGIATVLSGAGPSLLCLVQATELDAAASLAERLAPEGWQVLRPSWNLTGADSTITK